VEAPEETGSSERESFAPGSILFHGTDWAGAEKIASSGFGASKDGKLGPGVYLTPSQAYALTYARRDGVLLEVQILTRVDVERVGPEDPPDWADVRTKVRALGLPEGPRFLTAGLEYCLQDRAGRVLLEVTGWRFAEEGPAEADPGDEEVDPWREEKELRTGVATVCPFGRITLESKRAGKARPEVSEPEVSRERLERRRLRLSLAGLYGPDESPGKDGARRETGEVSRAGRPGQVRSSA